MNLLAILIVLIVVAMCMEACTTPAEYKTKEGDYYD